MITTLIKENILLGLAYNSRDLVHHPHGGKYGDKQTDMVLEKELRYTSLSTDSRKRLLSRQAWLELLRP